MFRISHFVFRIPPVEFVRSGYILRSSLPRRHEDTKKNWPQRERREIKNQRLKSKITEQNSKITVELDFLIENCCFAKSVVYINPRYSILIWSSQAQSLSVEIEKSFVYDHLKVCGPGVMGNDSCDQPSSPDHLFCSTPSM